MKNKYGLLEEEMGRIRKRDETCIYCHKAMKNPSTGGLRKDWATIEHLNHLSPWGNPKTVAICCGSCNSSRGNKKLMDWFKMTYCIKRNINHVTVANPATY